MHAATPPSPIFFKHSFNMKCVRPERRVGSGFKWQKTDLSNVTNVGNLLSQVAKMIGIRRSYLLVIFLYRFLKVVVISIHLPVLNSNISSNNTEIWYIATGKYLNSCVTTLHNQSHGAKRILKEKESFVIFQLQTAI